MGSTGRIEALDETDFRTDSLVGSYFHGNTERQWQGCVVAEPVRGIYLVQLFEWLSGSSTKQVLVSITDMMDWSFYDAAEWMNDRYKSTVSHQWEAATVDNS